MTITMFVRDVVLKAVPKKLTRSPTRPSVELIRPIANGLSSRQGSCQEDKDSGEWPIFAVLTARSLVASYIFWLEESRLDRTETVLFYIHCKVSLATDQY
jgi:hypothetical protein